ncbi:hypothetical protein ABW21_db0209100 [Orbilia brochopaga]|nr:hypothetical protein ABW21_db0209100 [Drechslerella brochopaga]
MKVYPENGSCAIIPRSRYKRARIEKPSQDFKNCQIEDNNSLFSHTPLSFTATKTSEVQVAQVTKETRMNLPEDQSKEEDSLKPSASEVASESPHSGTSSQALIHETAKFIKAYAVKRAVEIARQHFFRHLSSLQPSTAAGGSVAESSGAGAEAPKSPERPNTRSRQSNKGKGRADGGGGEDGEDEAEDGDRRKRVRTRRDRPDGPTVRYACTVFANAMKTRENAPSSLDAAKWPIECYRSGFESTTRLRSHLYSHHYYGCKICHQTLTSADAFYAHHLEGCEQVRGNPPLWISTDQINQFKSKRTVTGIDTEERKWAWIYRIVFPNEDELPSPYWQPILADCQRQHFDTTEQRNALFGVLREQFERAVDIENLSAPLVESLLRNLKNVWHNVLDKVQEKFPTSDNIDIESWKAIFENLETDIASIVPNEGAGAQEGVSEDSEQPELSQTMGPATSVESELPQPEAFNEALDQWMNDYLAGGLSGDDPLPNIQ